LLNERWSLAELRVICATAGKWRSCPTASLYHPGFSEPVTNGQNIGIKIIDCERLKSQTSRARISELL